MIWMTLLVFIEYVFQRVFHDFRKWKIGEELLISYYKEHLLENPELFLVSKNENEINGFCRRYLVGNINYSERFLKHNFGKIFLRVFCLLSSGNKYAWKKICSFRGGGEVEFEDLSYKSLSRERKVDLLSIVYCPKFETREFRMN